MAALTVTVAQVKKGPGCITRSGFAAVTITAGQSIYDDVESPSTAHIRLADADAGLAQAKAIGIALHGALANQPIEYAVSGKVVIGAGAAPAKGTIYVVGAAAGAIAPHGDLAQNWYTTILGVGDGVDTIDMGSGVRASGQQVP